MNKMEVTYEELIERIKMLRDHFNLSYLLRTYIDREAWINNLKMHFGVDHVENMTDFSYSRAFSYFINIPDSPMSFNDRMIDQQIQNMGALYRCQILISLLGPFVAVNYYKYSFVDDVQRQECSPMPFVTEHQAVKEAIEGFCQKHNLRIIPPGLLGRRVPDVKLELRGEETRVYDIFFEE